MSMLSQIEQRITNPNQARAMPPGEGIELVLALAGRRCTRAHEFLQYKKKDMSLGLIMLLAVLLLFTGCVKMPKLAPELVPDYHNGKPNALICPNDRPCFQCDHETAMFYANLYMEGKWDGGIAFLPIDKEP